MLSLTLQRALVLWTKIVQAIHGNSEHEHLIIVARLFGF